MITIGLVLEGKYDFPLIAACLKSELRRYAAEDIQFVNLQPKLDATGEIESGGWSKVAGWLANFSGGGIATFLTPLFATADACDLIVVHMDADIRTELYRNIGSSCVPTADVASIAQEIESELRRLLSAGDLDRKVSFAIPVFKSENWLMAGSALCQDDRWCEPDAKREIRTLFDPKLHSSKLGMVLEMLEEIAASTDLLYNRAKSYRPFRDGLHATMT